MPITVRLPLAIILLCCLFAQQAALAGQIPQEQKKQLAVLKIDYVDFSRKERDRVNATFYEQLVQDRRLSVIDEAQSRRALIPYAIDPHELGESGYINAGITLGVDYVLVGKMEKVGDFVEVTFRVFTMPRGAQKEYPGGKTMDLFVTQEIPKIVDLIRSDLVPTPAVSADSLRMNRPPAEKSSPPAKQTKIGKKSKWPWLAIGGAAAGGIAAAVILSSGGNENATPKRGLPRPPVVPE